MFYIIFKFHSEYQRLRTLWYIMKDRGSLLQVFMIFLLTAYMTHLFMAIYLREKTKMTFLLNRDIFI